MTVRIDGTNTAANPGITGTDTDTGLQFGTDEVNIVTGGATRATVDSSGRLLVSSGDLRVTGTEGVSASLYLIADQGDDNGDGWRLNSNQDDNDLTISTNTTGSYVDQVGILTSGDFRFNSGFGSVATAYGVRAWVNFEGTSTAAIKEDGGISSFTDVDTGKYIIGFATTMPDANYCPIMGVCNDSYAGTVLSLGQDGPTGGVYSKTTTQLQFRVSKNGGDFGVVDVNEVSIAIIR